MAHLPGLLNVAAVGDQVFRGSSMAAANALSTYPREHSPKLVPPLPQAGADGLQVT